LRVERADGTRAVLKVNPVEYETEHEPTALALWRGEGAVRLFEHDAERYALLIERCEPGTQLWAVQDDDEANTIAAGVLRRIWREPPAPHPFRLLRDEAERWAGEIPADWASLGRPFEASIVDAAVGALRELGPTQADAVVCHQDFHGGNVLRATREPWLAIDPKPLVGERAFDTASLIRDRRPDLLGGPNPGRRLRRRLDQLSADLELDRERMRGWAIAHALAWGVDLDDVHEEHIACARLLMEA